MASCTSPRVSLMTLPISQVMSRAYSSLRAISSSAALKSVSARRGAGTRRHFLKAWRAASIAWLTSSLPDFWKMPTTWRVSAGLRFSKVRPVRLSTHLPAIKFLKTFGFAPPPILADVCSMVATGLPSTACCKPLIVAGGEGRSNWGGRCRGSAFLAFANKCFREISGGLRRHQVSLRWPCDTRDCLIVLLCAQESISAAGMGLSEIRFQADRLTAFGDGFVILRLGVRKLARLNRAEARSHRETSLPLSSSVLPTLRLRVI